MKDKVIGKLKCRKSQAEYDWWTEGKVYDVLINAKGHAYVIDDEGDICVGNYYGKDTATDISGFIEDLKHRDVYFEEVPLESDIENPTHLRCVNDGGVTAWWVEGKDYEIHYGDYAMSIIDEEGDPRFSPTPEDFIKEFGRFGTVFEPVYLEPSSDNPLGLAERLKKDIERLKKDQLHLLQKRARIHKQIGKLRNKDGRLQRDLNLLEAYLDDVVNPFSKDISKEIEKVVWRLRLDVVRLENKARRINNQAISLGAKACRLEEDLKVIKKYI